MADISDVEIAAVDILVAAFYPNGPAGTSAAGTTCRIYRGWPQPAALNADLANNTVNITVCPGAGPDEILPCYLDEDLKTPPACTLTAAAAGDTATFGGTPAIGQIAGILADGIPYAYPVAAGDSTQQIAAALTALIQADRLALCAGSSVRVPGSHRLVARAVASAQAALVLRRQKKQLKISCWCPSPTSRDAVAKLIDGSIGARRFVSLPDQSGMYLQYVSTELFDQSQSAFLFRRDMNYTAQYILTAVASHPTMLFGILNKNARPSVV
jgi:hypothetical protein